MLDFSGMIAALLLLSACGGPEDAAGGFRGEVRILHDATSGQASFFLLLPGGHIYQGLPADGELDEFDLEKARSAAPERAGTFTDAGGQMVITWGGGKKETWKHLKNSEGQEQMNSLLWFKAQPFATGRRIRGVYNWSSASQAARSIEFRADGTFSARGAAYVPPAAGNDPAAAPSQSDVSGTYEINHCTLTLKQKDGTTTHTFLNVGRPDSAQQPLMLVFDSGLIIPAKK